jgi:hypothetical protein
LFDAVDTHGPAHRRRDDHRPFNPTGPATPPSRRQIPTCRPATAAEEAPCARTIIGTIARKAYRRPVPA